MMSSKRAFVFQGPGFLREMGVDSALRALGFEIHRISVSPHQPPSLGAEPKSEDLILLRGDWDAIPEEMAYSRLLGAQFVALGQSLKAMKPEGRPTVIASGRWALSVMWGEWTRLPKASISAIAWLTLPETLRGPWIEARLEHSEVFYYSRLLGRAVPELPPQDFEACLIGKDSTSLGWKHEDYLHLFFADPLAFAHGSQLEGFGYENHEDLKNNVAFLTSLLGARDAARI